MKPLIAALAPMFALTLVAAPAFSQTAAAPAAAALAPDASPARPLPYGTPIALDAARAMIAHALEDAEARGLTIAVAIVEPSGEMVAFARMDNVQYGSIYLARRKAETSARYRRATSVSQQRLTDGALGGLANDDMMPMGGGLPIVIDGRIVGGIGISGGSTQEDEAMSAAAIASFTGG